MAEKVVIVTGANGGLGTAIARHFLETDPDAFVWLGVHRGLDKATSVASEFANRCSILELDVTDPRSWDESVKKVLEVKGTLDVLINNAGGHRDMLLAQMPANDWTDITRLNLDSVYYGCHAVLPTMISKRQGRIINIASLSALLAPAGQCNYAAAKAGVVALTQSLAKEVARIGITINAVCPGFIDTESMQAMDDEARKTMKAKIPMRRFGVPEEVAPLVVFLSGPGARYITGTAIKIDGGIL